MDALLDELETLIRRDPAMRGLISSEARFGRLCPGHFAAAAKSLSERIGTVAILTGFYVPAADPPTAETDGPPGAVRLAQALEGVGHRVVLITDARCAKTLQVAAEAMGFPPDRILTFPDAEEAAWTESCFSPAIGRELTHLVAVERVGPSHTEESLKQWSDEAMLREFLEQVPAESRGHCHNMRGEMIDAWTGRTHLLFEWSAENRPEVRTLGIGDGGNEIGMGCLRWDDVSRRLLGDAAVKIPCRVATDWNLIAGTSNWGGYALAAAVLTLGDRIPVMEPWTCRREQDILEQLVVQGPAVDGATRRQEATVDGLPFLTYIQPWAAIRRRLGLEE